ncbi:MAG: hypothetical protein QHH15_00200 [Candidatus Thermoplasmatota archaeon]|nr:hypothetical protein [Candidatus Thermoplasmatota archaeon]
MKDIDFDMGLEFKEPVLLKVPDYDEEGKKHIKIFEVIPLQVEDMYLTVQFAEMQKKVEKIRFESTKDEKSRKKGKGKGKKGKEEDRKIPTVLNPEMVNVSEEEEKFVIEELLPLVDKIVKVGLVDFKTREKVELPQRLRTLQKLMIIAVKIVNVTTETDTPIDLDFRMGEVQKNK